MTADKNLEGMRDTLSSNTDKLKSASPRNRVDRWVHAAKNHPVLSVVIFVAMVFGGIAGVTEGIVTIHELLSGNLSNAASLSERGILGLRTGLSDRNSKILLSIQGLPADVPAKFYTKPVIRELKKRFDNVELVDQADIMFEINLIRKSNVLYPVEQDEPESSLLWGTALVVINVDQNVIEMIEDVTLTTKVLTGAFADH